MMTHLALLTGAAVENEHWPMDRPRLLHMTPVNRIAGVGMVGVFGLLEEERIQHVLGPPVQFHMMANHPDFGARNLSRLEFITWGGAPMAADLVAVLGVADRAFGEIGHAFVEPKPGRSPDAVTLDAWCRERLANYKIPKRFEMRAELPRLPIGKIDKQTLKRELVERGGV